MKKFIFLLSLISLHLTGCSTFGDGGAKAQKDKIHEMAIHYVQEKYNLEAAEVTEVALSSSGSNGPIPDFKREASKSGVVFFRKSLIDEIIKGKILIP